MGSFIFHEKKYPLCLLSLGKQLISFMKELLFFLIQ